MSETHPVRLTVEEIEQQARKFFGARGLGLEPAVDQPGLLRFEGSAGFVQLRTQAAANNQSRLTIEHHGFEQAIHDFRRLLGRQAAAATSM